MALLMVIVLSLLVISSGADGRGVEFEPRWANRSVEGKEFPYQVILEIKNNIAEPFCTGSILSDRYVLTAARCMFGGSDGSPLVATNTSITLYAGVLDRSNLRGPTVQKRESKSIIFSPRPKGLSYYHGLALVEVSQPFIILPGTSIDDVDVSESSFSTLVDNNCKTGSFGNIKWNDNNSEKKPETWIKKLGHSVKRCTCVSELEDAAPHSAVDEWICSKAAFNVALCRGDFGVALICEAFLQAVFVDLVNYYPDTCRIHKFPSHNCGDQNTVTIFVDICQYVEWLNDYVPGVDPDCEDSCAFTIKIHPVLSLATLLIVISGSFTRF